MADRVAASDLGKFRVVRIVIVGATGNIGTSLVQTLTANDRVESVVGISRRRPSWSHPKVTWAQCDVTVDDVHPFFVDVDAVVHLAWLLQPTRRPMVTWRANVGGSQRVFSAAGEAGVGAVVYASSLAAYSPAPGRRVDESWPTDSMPTAAYGREKAYVERVLDSFEAHHPDIRVVRIRPSFSFKRESATSQRRLFAGPLLPNALLERGRLPFLPLPSKLQFQAVHSDDVAEAYVRAVVSDARGAYNVAAEPVIDGDVLGELLGTRVVELPRAVIRTGLATAYLMRLVPVDPALLDLLLELPLLDTTRAAQELDWSPRHSAVDALEGWLQGVVAGAGMPTPPLAPDSLSGRVREFGTGAGARP